MRIKKSNQDLDEQTELLIHMEWRLADKELLSLF